MLSLLIIVALTYTTVDTLQGISSIEIYNQIGNVHFIHSSFPYIKITTHTATLNPNIFSIVKKTENHNLILKVEPNVSCRGCYSEIEVGSDKLKVLNIEVANGKVSIKSDVQKTYISVLSGEANLEGTLLNVNVEILSGNLTINNLTADTLYAFITDGRVIANFSSVVKEGKIRVVSGKVKLHPFQNQKLFAILSSKNDTIKKDGEGFLKIEVTSGNLELAKR